MSLETPIDPTASLSQHDVALKLPGEITKSGDNQTVSQVLLNEVDLIIPRITLSRWLYLKITACLPLMFCFTVSLTSRTLKLVCDTPSTPVSNSNTSYIMFKQHSRKSYNVD
jgi:hypothetical protein